MSKLWMLWLPVLFLPNLGFARATSHGVLEISDFLIGPYLLLLVLVPRNTTRRQVDLLFGPLGVFVAWALLSTVTMLWRFDYDDSYFVTFGLLKIAKMGLYGVAGLLTVRALAADPTQRVYHWSLCFVAVVLGVSLLLASEGPTVDRHTGEATEGFKAANAVSVTAATLVCYLAGLLSARMGTRIWRQAACIGIVALLLGAAVSHGRGGWVAMIVGLSYLFYHLGFRKGVVLGLLVLCAGTVTAYSLFPQFQNDIELTINPGHYDAREVDEEPQSAISKLDDGGRPGNWWKELKKMPQHAILGWGFFHRGGRSQLSGCGSHNFFLQMLLETGLLGGGLILLVYWTLWKQSGCATAVARRQSLPARSALVAMFVGALGGEYLYGGTVLLMLFLVYAPIGVIPTETADRVPAAGSKGRRHSTTRRTHGSSRRATQRA